MKVALGLARLCPPMSHLDPEETPAPIPPRPAPTTSKTSGPFPNPWCPPWPECQETLYPVAPGTLFQVMVTDELLT